MNKVKIVKMQLDPFIKKRVHDVFSSAGITPTQAIIMFYHYVDRERDFPFEISVPNKQTSKTIQEARAGKGLIESKSLEDLFSELDI